MAHVHCSEVILCAQAPPVMDLVISKYVFSSSLGSKIIYGIEGRFGEHCHTEVSSLAASLVIAVLVHR